MTTVASAPASIAPMSIRPPMWLVITTGVFAIGCLAMAVAETSLWMHYLIDAGESISLIGVAFIFAAGAYLYRQRRLLVSLPMTLPWLLFPVITQGDQIIDNLSINSMRLFSHVVLAALFGAPVLIVVVAVRHAVASGTAAPAADPPVWLAIIPGVRQMRRGRTREGGAILAAMLLVAEMWIAIRFLGLLMVVTLIVMVWGVLAYGAAGTERVEAVRDGQPRAERGAFAVLVAGVLLSLGLFFGFKNRPGAYQGSPSYYMDPTQQNTRYSLDLVAVPAGVAAVPADPAAVRGSLTTYARALERLLEGYYVLDRNYNYHFHNELFLRSTPLLADYRAVGLGHVAEAEALRAEADRITASARQQLSPTDPLAALVDDVAGYAAFTFNRAPKLATMSAEFQQTKAGLQHATHLYEGEGKAMGEHLLEILVKHQAVLSSSHLEPVTGEFASISRGIHARYANRIVGF